jgi:uncharacterized membrane protein YdbT with pleckstrin-like domain
MTSRISDYLHRDESLIMLIRMHPATLMGPIVLVVAGLTVALLYSTSSGTSGIIVILIWSAWGLLVLNLIYKVLQWWEACFAVTTKRMLLITGLVTRLSDSRDLDKVKGISFERSAVGRLLGYGSLIESAGTNQKSQLNFVPSQAFKRIARVVPANAQQANVERGGDHMAVNKERPTSADGDADGDSERLRRRKSIVLMLIWIAALAAAVAVAEIPRIGTLANSELPIIAVALAATGPIIGSRWTSGR